MTTPSTLPDRRTVAALLVLTAATGLVDAVSVLVFGHVFVANMTGNIVFLGFWFVTGTGVDLVAAVVAVFGFLAGTIVCARITRTLPNRWLTIVLVTEIAVLSAVAALAGAGILHYHDNTKYLLIGGLALTFGMQNAMARRFGVPELSTTVLTSTIVGIGVDSRLAGGTGQREKLRYGVLFAMAGGAVIGATLSRWMVAPVIALAAALVASALGIFGRRG